MLQKEKQKIESIVNEGYDNNILTKEEFRAMLPSDDVTPGRFMQHLKYTKSIYMEQPPQKGL